MGLKIKQQAMLSQLIVDGSDESKFCLLVGAGASFSSGIPTAGHLVNQWKEELRSIESKDNPILKKYSIYDQEFMGFYRDWKIRKSGDLINPSDYSILMEYFRPTPALRQAFIEEAVNGKYPGFGYLYLSMLIDAGYFNVLFTTNFDNLVNDALYRFVDSRPLVCSFDSNVSSIRIASKRPKIIKLHGDYLFNNIKNTSSEVRSLTKNMEDKFKQFCTEYGLIVIGYSGGDDSVMDIIKSMLKDEEYLKMGLHWCIRKGDEVPIALESSAGLSDRLHFYKIESFDTLMSDVCKRANIPLPIEVTDPTKSKTITKLTDSVKSQTNTNLSIKILDDAVEIVHSLQNRTVEHDILIKELHLLGKRIQEYRDKIPSQETVNSVHECISCCEKILNDSAPENIESAGFTRGLNTEEKVDIYLIIGIAKISQAKVSTTKKDKILLCTEIIESLSSITIEAKALSTSTMSNHRTIFCRLHFNIACVFGLLAQIEKQKNEELCKKAVRSLSMLRGINEGLPFLEKVTRNEEEDLLVFKTCDDFKNFHSN